MTTTITLPLIGWNNTFFRSYSKDEKNAKMYVFEDGQGIVAIEEIQMFVKDVEGKMVERKGKFPMMKPIEDNTLFILRHVNEEGDACRIKVWCKYENDVTTLTQIGHLVWE